MKCVIFFLLVAYLAIVTASGYGYLKTYKYGYLSPSLGYRPSYVGETSSDYFGNLGNNRQGYRQRGYDGYSNQYGSNFGSGYGGYGVGSYGLRPWYNNYGSSYIPDFYKPNYNPYGTGLGSYGNNYGSYGNKYGSYGNNYGSYGKDAAGYGLALGGYYSGLSNYPSTYSGYGGYGYSSQK
ncbi:hypothetical protein QE152_g30762 [Popillia japonica]|uniref:Uncharacterized protein n=1 Tax=Popillia japonica TaxID=7064 RepID=A0AAW1JCW4_POPJA